MCPATQPGLRFGPIWMVRSDLRIFYPQIRPHLCWWSASYAIPTRELAALPEPRLKFALRPAVDARPSRVAVCVKNSSDQHGSWPLSLSIHSFTWQDRCFCSLSLSRIAQSTSTRFRAKLLYSKNGPPQFLSNLTGTSTRARARVLPRLYRPQSLSNPLVTSTDLSTLGRNRTCSPQLLSNPSATATAGLVAPRRRSSTSTSLESLRSRPAAPLVPSPAPRFAP